MTIQSRVVTGLGCCSPQVHTPTFPSSEIRKKDGKMMPLRSHPKTDKAHGQIYLLQQSLLLKIKLKRWELHTEARAHEGKTVLI